MTDEEIKELVNEFNRKVSLDPEIRSVMQKIRNQDADFSDTSRMFWRRSELLRNYLQGVVLDLPAGAREQLCTALLNAGYNETNEVMQSVQQAQDEPQGIHLNPVLPKRPAERIHIVSHALEDPTVPDDKIVRRAGAPVANVQMSFHDRYIEENAKIRAKLGMKPIITRYGSGCCSWCSAVAGRYRFGDQPKDIFRRHDNCGCTIIYDNQVLRGRETSSGRSKTWEEVDPKSVEALGFTPTVHTQEQAKKLQDSQLKLLTTPGKGSIINYAKPLEMLNFSDIPSTEIKTPERIIQELGKSNIGKEILGVIENLPEPIKFTYGEWSTGLRGEENNGAITIYLNNCKNVLWAARTIIHECTHYRYGIGQSQWAECVCVAQELKHARNRDTLTQEELRTIVSAVKDSYPELKWKKGGIINGRKKR